MEKKGFESLDTRLRTLQGSVHEAEARMEALGAKARSLSQLHQTVDTLGKDPQGLSTQADELAQKQAGLETLHERLGQVEELANRTAREHDALKQGRPELDALRQQFQEIHKSYADMAQLRDRLSADRTALEAFGERMTAFMLRTPQLDATLNAINAKLATVDEGMKQTTRLGELASEVDAQVTRISARAQSLDKLEARTDALHTLATEVDGKLAEQLGRRAELETLKSQCDAVLAHTLDAQQKIEAVAARQKKLLPVTNRLSALEDRLEKTGARIDEVTRDEAVLSEQETRLAECLEMSRTLAGETTERMTQIQALGDELARADAIKEELISELARIQTRQRDATAQVEATEDHLKRTETMHKQLEQRRTQLVFSEKKVAAVEVKMSELAQRAAGLDQTIKGILERQAVVAAVKAEVDSVHDISARSRADLQFVTEHRDEVAAVRRQIKDLLATAQENGREDCRHRGAPEDGRRGSGEGESHLKPPRGRERESRDPGRAEIRHRPRGREAGENRLHHAGGPEHASDAAARARAGRAHGAEHQAAADQDREGRPPPQVGRLVGHGVGPRPRLEISRRKGQHAPRILDQDPAHHRLAHARLTKLRNDRRQDHVDSGPALLSQVPLCGEISGEQHAVLMPGVQHGEDRSDVLSGTTSSGLPE